MKRSLFYDTEFVRDVTWDAWCAAALKDLSHAGYELESIYRQLPNVCLSNVRARMKVVVHSRASFTLESPDGKTVYMFAPRTEPGTVYYWNQSGKKATWDGWRNNSVWPFVKSQKAPDWSALSKDIWMCIFEHLDWHERTRVARLPVSRFWMSIGEKYAARWTRHLQHMAENIPSVQQWADLVAHKEKPHDALLTLQRIATSFEYCKTPYFQISRTNFALCQSIFGTFMERITRNRIPNTFSAKTSNNDLMSGKFKLNIKYGWFSHEKSGSLNIRIHWIFNVDSRYKDLVIAQKTIHEIIRPEK